MTTDPYTKIISNFHLMVRFTYSFTSFLSPLLKIYANTVLDAQGQAVKLPSEKEMIDGGAALTITFDPSGPMFSSP